MLHKQATFKEHGALAGTLEKMPKVQRDFILNWVEVIAHTNIEMAFQMLANSERALSMLTLEQVKAWILKGMDRYDKNGLYPAVTHFRQVADFIHEMASGEHGATLDSHRRVLEYFVQGLGGRKLEIDSGDRPWTDTNKVHLPTRLFRFPDKQLNSRLYKIMTALLWAQTRFGTFRQTPAEQPDIVNFKEYFDDASRALTLFNLLETRRLEAHINRQLPGIFREMKDLSAIAGDPGDPPGWEDRLAVLNTPQASVATTWRLVEECHDDGGSLPSGRCYQGVINTTAARRAIEERHSEVKRALAIKLSEMGQQLGLSPQQMRVEARADKEGVVVEHFAINGEATAPPVDIEGLLLSVIQDFGALPETFLVPAGSGGYPQTPPPEGETGGGGALDADPDAFYYDEWDYLRRHYRKRWCILREIDQPPGDPAFVAQTLKKYSTQLPELRRIFEAMRDDLKRLRRQPAGDEIDLDALVEAQADICVGREVSDRLFTLYQKEGRNLATLFMVDVSGSTKGWINDAERESLVLLCEALEILGDRYAIYGFSGSTRNRCMVYRIKSFAEPYTERVKGRIAGISPKEYTRMGVTIRHLTGILSGVDARTRLLITLSDGKPDDYDVYRGEYGIEDTRQALIEAKHAGIHPYCITIDREARGYLPHMYGAVNYTVIDEVRKLPLKVSDIYSRLTS